MSTRSKLFVLLSLYLAQGVPYGFFTQALPVLLRQMGVSLEHIGLTSLLAIPWAIKFLWAPVVDRVGSRRRWVLRLQGCSVLLALAIATLDPTASLGIVLVAVCLTNLVAATQDTATDGIAVQLLRPEELGYGNGVQVAGYRVGMIIGGSALLVLYDDIGWAMTFLGMAAVLALATIPLWKTPTVGRAPAPASTEPTTRQRNPWSWTQIPGAWRWAAVLVAFKLGDYLCQGMMRPWMVDAGLSTREIGVLVGAGGFGAGLLGAAVGGGLVQRVGALRALRWFGWLQAAGLGLYALTDSLGVPTAMLWATVVFEHFVGGLATVALFTAMMTASRRQDASTDYTLQASIVVIASGVGAGMSGFVAGGVGYGTLFAGAAILAMLGPAMAASRWFTVIVSQAAPTTERPQARG